jgi:thioredoxin 1
MAASEGSREDAARSANVNKKATAPVAVTGSSFQSTVLEAPQPVLVDFGAEWCGPCVAVAPVIRDLAIEYAERLRVATVDVDAEPELAARYGVRSVPTVLLLEDGEVRRVLVGARSSREYREAIDEVLH